MRHCNTIDMANCKSDLWMQIGGRQKTPAYLLNTLKPGHVIEGPAILFDDISTVVVEPECTAYITAGQDIRIEVLNVPTSLPSQTSAAKIDYCWFKLLSMRLYFP